ncbi:hypothetical protein [Halocatena halophila]|uniref:hypothetical protein n=1 Tax=Halocatena halophila TaxID=2814576 RepID=UPI002ED29A92
MAAPSVSAILVVVLIVQLILAVGVLMDANRRQLTHPLGYAYGVSVPLAGYLVFAAYLTRRTELPANAAHSQTHSEPKSEFVWTIENRGLRRLPWRLAYAIQDGTTLWRVAKTTPLLLFICTILVDPRIAKALLLFCLLFWLTYLTTARLFIDTTVRLQPADDTIQVIGRGSDHPLSPGGYDHEIDLSDLTRVELRRVGTQPLAIFRYTKRFSNSPRSLVVPNEQLAQLRHLLDANDVPIHDRMRDDSSRGAVQRRCAEGFFSLLILPLATVMLWPQHILSGPVVAFSLFCLLWLAVKSANDVIEYASTQLRSVQR